MKFQIGDMVRTVEPKYDGMRFKLIGFDEKQDAILSVTCSPLLLEKIDDDPLKVGDLVEIIGPCVDGSEWCMGKRFTISQTVFYPPGKEGYSAPGFPAYPASRLRKVQPEVSEIAKLREEMDGRFDEAREYSDNLEKITETLANRIYALDQKVDELKRDALTGEKLARALSRPCDCGRP